jgi:mono/diheme cytochrome c family protein
MRRLQLIPAVLLVGGMVIAMWSGASARAAQSPTARVAPAQDSITPAMIALGDSIFHGRVAGGTCMACHAQNAKGVPGLGPDLTDRTWLHGDGSVAFILGIVEKGVPKPKQSAAPMPPGGGAQLTLAQKGAVAAYVWSLSQPR